MSDTSKLIRTLSIGDIISDSNEFQLFRDEDTGTTALHAAVSGGNINNVKKLATIVNIESQDAHGNRPIHIACSTERAGTDVLKFLISEYKLNLNHKNAEKETALHIACKAESIEKVKVLLEGGADVNVRDAKGNTPLHIAGLARATEIVTYLLNKRADPNTVNKAGQSILQIAYMLNCHDMIKVLNSHLNEQENLTSLINNLVKEVNQVKKTSDNALETSLKLQTQLDELSQSHTALKRKFENEHFLSSTDKAVRPLEEKLQRLEDYIYSYTAHKQTAEPNKERKALYDKLKAKQNEYEQKLSEVSKTVNASEKSINILKEQIERGKFGARNRETIKCNPDLSAIEKKTTTLFQLYEQLKTLIEKTQLARVDAKLSDPESQMQAASQSPDTLSENSEQNLGQIISSDDLQSPRHQITTSIQVPQVNSFSDTRSQRPSLPQKQSKNNKQTNLSINSPRGNRVYRNREAAASKLQSVQRLAEFKFSGNEKLSNPYHREFRVLHRQQKHRSYSQDTEKHAKLSSVNEEIATTIRLEQRRGSQEQLLAGVETIICSGCEEHKSKVLIQRPSCEHFRCNSCERKDVACKKCHHPFKQLKQTYANPKALK